MAIAPEQEQSDFGANDWLLEEMYEQYQADPASGDPQWAEFFKARGQGGNDAPAKQTAPAADK